MSRHEEADLILKLYDLRREPTMRKAREWFIQGFFPESIDDIKTAMSSEQGAYLRMVATYWDMAAALVNHGAIGVDLFNDTNGEHFVIFCKLQPHLNDARQMFGPQFLRNLEQLIETSPHGLERIQTVRGRIAAMRQVISQRQQAAANV